jgi:hypothetical protein
MHRTTCSTWSIVRSSRQRDYSTPSFQILFVSFVCFCWFLLLYLVRVTATKLPVTQNCEGKVRVKVPI